MPTLLAITFDRSDIQKADPLRLGILDTKLLYIESTITFFT